MNQLNFDPKEMIGLMAAGFVVGILIMVVLTGISFGLGLSPSIWAGIPSS